MSIWTDKLGAVLQELFLVVDMLDHFGAADEIELMFILGNQLFERNVPILDLIRQIRGVKMGLRQLYTPWCRVNSQHALHSQTTKAFR